MTQPAQSSAGARPPAFRTPKTQGNQQFTMAIWGKTEAHGAHVSGQSTIVDTQGIQSTVNFNGFFKISDKGEVKLSLSTRGANGYETFGTVYFSTSRDGVSKITFYPQNKALPNVALEVAPGLPHDVAEAIGVALPAPQLNQNQQSTAAPHPQETHQAPSAPSAQPTPAPANSTPPVGATQRPRYNA